VVDPPFGNYSIRRQPPLSAGGLAIKVWIVAIDDHAELFKIEIGVARLERVERPFDPTDTALYRRIALGKLKARSNTFAAVIALHRKNMRMPVRETITEARKRTQETDHSAVIECT